MTKCSYMLEIAEDSPERPATGDHVAGCGHVDAKQAHFWLYQLVVLMRRPDGSTFTPKPPAVCRGGMAQDSAQALVSAVQLAYATPKLPAS